MEALNQIVAVFQQLDAAMIGGFVGLLLLILIFVMYRRMQRSVPVRVDVDSPVDDAPEPLYERSLTPAETQLESAPQPEPAPVEASVVEREAEPSAQAPRPSAADLRGSIIEKAAQLNVDTSRAETLQSSATVPSAPTVIASDVVPQDSVLRRHYLTERKAGREAIANPYPTDSVLRRHYDALHRIDVGLTAGRAESRVGETSDLAATRGGVDRVPEEAVLRRHFVAGLRARIEAGLSPKPSDSVLRRHYEALVDAELHRRMERLGG